MSITQRKELDDIIIYKNTDLLNLALTAHILSKNFAFNKTIVKYPENKAYLEAKKISNETGRYDIKNGNTPKSSPLSPEDKIRADEYFEHIKDLCDVLGYKMFDSYINEEEQTSVKDLFFINKGAIDAKGELTDEGFVVLKGSKVAHLFIVGTTQWFKDFGKKLRDDGVIVNDVFNRRTIN